MTLREHLPLLIIKTDDNTVRQTDRQTYINKSLFVKENTALIGSVQARQIVSQ